MKLEIDLVPSSCWYSNVRSNVSSSQWNKIRKKVYSKFNFTCAVCKRPRLKRPEAHEIFEYDDETSIQRLKEIICICSSCHMSKHYGLSQIRGKETEVQKHMMKVNSCTKSEIQKHVRKSFKVWEKRSQKDWNLDLTYLRDEYGIEICLMKRKDRNGTDFYKRKNT